MHPEEALKIVLAAAEQALLPRVGHVQVQQAEQVLRAFVKASAQPPKTPNMPPAPKE